MTTPDSHPPDPVPLTEAEIAELEQAYQRLADGEWVARENEGDWFVEREERGIYEIADCYDYGKNNATFIALAHSLLPRLILALRQKTEPPQPAEAEVQSIINDLDSAVAWLPDELRLSVMKASELLAAETGSLAALRAENERLKGCTATLDDENSLLCQQLKESDERNNTLHIDYENAVTSAAKWKTSWSLCQQRVEGLEKECEALRGEIEAIEDFLAIGRWIEGNKRLSAIAGAKMKYQRECWSNVRNQISNLESQIADSKAENERLNQRASDAETLISLIELPEDPETYSDAQQAVFDRCRQLDVQKKEAAARTLLCELLDTPGTWVSITRKVISLRDSLTEIESSLLTSRERAEEFAEAIFRVVGLEIHTRHEGDWLEPRDSISPSLVEDAANYLLSAGILKRHENGVWYRFKEAKPNA